jgi:general secretion pathway protein D
VGVAGFQNSVNSLFSGVPGLVGSVTAAGGSDALTGLALGIQGPAINATGVSIPSFGVALAALASSGDSDVLSTPHLLALNNEEAEINIGQNAPLQASVASPLSGLGGLAGLGGAAGATGATSQLGALGALGGLGGLGGGTIPRGDVGTRIRITPHINESDEIRLDIDEEISEVGAAIANSNVGAVPINKRTAKTKVVVRDQQTVVIGGLMKDSVSTSQTKVPLLGDIPVIGQLFRKTSSTKTKTNLLLFLTPYIVRSQADLRGIYERKMRERQEFLDRYFVFGTHDYHPTLDYSRTRGLVAEIMKQVSNLHRDKQLADDLANQPSPEHIPRIAIGSAMRRNLPDATGPEAGDTVIEGGTQTTPTTPQGATPPSPTPGAVNTNTPDALPAAPGPGGNSSTQDSTTIAPGSSGNAAAGGGARTGSRNNALIPSNNALTPNNDALAPANDQLAPVTAPAVPPPPPPPPQE